MKKSTTNDDQPLLKVLSRVRAIRITELKRYPPFHEISEEALRKRLDRARVKGLIAASALPTGHQLYRLSAKGARLFGLPPSWASSPSLGIVAETLSISANAWKKDEYLFLTPSDFKQLVAELVDGPQDEKLPPRLATSTFVLRYVTDPATKTQLSKLDYWLCELKSAEELERRIQVIVPHLLAISALAKLHAAQSLGLSVAVPSEGVKQTLQRKTLPIETHILVVEELAELFH